MINDNDRELFGVTIEISLAIAANDLEAAEALIKKVNGMRLTDSSVQILIDAMDAENIVGLKPGEPDAYVALVNGLDCIVNKEYRLKLHNLTVALDKNDRSGLKTFVDQAVSADQLLDSVENDYRYISMLIRACLILKDYQSMEAIRGKLVN